MQVVRAAEEVDVTISTSGSSNECAILDTVRAYDTGGEVLGDGFFTIQVLVEQVVYTASQESLTLANVTGLVENGYNRGRGGRVKFRNLLQESSAFDNVLDVEVLAELGAPMVAPTTAPATVATESPTKSPTLQPTTQAPTESPSSSPTQEPSAIPSQVPSMVPSAYPSVSPTAVPSVIPTEAPSQSPSLFDLAGVVPTLSGEPTAKPSSIGAAVATTRGKTPPYVIAAIVLGSWAVLMACCFSIFLCRKNRKESDEQRLLSSGRPSNEDSTPPLRDSQRHPDRSKQSSEQSQEISNLPIIPDVILADDDHRSLANTTLGEQTAGRKPPKKKRLVDTGITINSFEDDSLYTSPIGIIPRIQPGRRIDEDEDDKKRKIHSPPTLGASSAFESDIFFSSETGSSSQESWVMPPSPVASKIGDLLAAELGPVAGENPEALPSEQGSQYTESRDDVDGMTGAAPWPTQSLSPRSSHSSLHSSLHSSDTLKTQNVAAAIAVMTGPITNEDCLTVDAPGTYAKSGSSTLLVRKKLDDDKFSSEKEPAKSPLQLLETHKEESPTAVEKEQSPMQMLEEEDMKTDVSPIDLQDSDSTVELRQSSSLSSDRPPRAKKHPWQTGKTPRTPTESSPNDHTARRSVSPYRTRYLQGLQSPTTQLEFEQTPSYGSQRTPPILAPKTRPVPAVPGHSPKSRNVTPLLDMLPAVYGMNKGENARQNTLESPPPVSLAEGDISVLTTSSSDTSTSENPWLFDTVAQALGPRSASADMESLGGKSNKSTKSNKSGKSWRSQRSAKSLGTRRGRKRRKGGSVGSRGSQRSSFSFGSPGAYRSSTEFSLAPRSLENDLKRLEQQLASLKSTDPKKQQHRPPSPPGITGTSNSISASRRKVSSKQRIVVVAPPGKLGVILANRHNGTGTVVSELRGSSVLNGALFPGDKLCK